MVTNQLAVFIDFENVALWAEHEFFDFKITKLMEFIQVRGPAVVKRAYADWTRFARYRDEMMNNSIDLIQIYSVRAGKNRADIRMAIDALETAVTRPQINTFVIVSGDSDFSPLVARLREYGHYTVGVGPRNITHDLLVRSCDEFIYLETALGEPPDVDDQSCIEMEQARELLMKAIQAHGQRGELPVLATRLKQTMLLMDPAFNEANFGYSQFKSWLEDNHDIVRLYLKDLQLLVSPADESVANGINNVEADSRILPIKIKQKKKERPDAPRLQNESQYRHVMRRLKLADIDLATRRDILRDIYRELNAFPGKYSSNGLSGLLQERYGELGLLRNAEMIQRILQLAIRQDAFEVNSKSSSTANPLTLVKDVDSEAIFVRRAETDILYNILRAGIEIEEDALAYVLFNDRNQVEYIQYLLEDLESRGKIIRKGDRYSLPGRGLLPCEDEPALEILCRDIENTSLPKNVIVSAETAKSLARKAMLQRSQDFAASSDTYLLACRVQWEAIENGEPGATTEDLRWYMASYASTLAGKLSQVNKDYASARPYYQAFFALVKEEDPLWSRMRGLINPMLAYYWANAGRELDINVSAWNTSMTSPAQIAVLAATHPNQELRSHWKRITSELAKINPGLLSRIVGQLRLNQSEQPENASVANEIENILRNDGYP